MLSIRKLTLAYYMPNDIDRYRIVPLILIGVVTAVSLALAIAFSQNRSTQIREELSERSQTVAAAIDPDDVNRFTGTSKDDGTAVYKDLKSQLAAVKKANHNVRSIYLTGERDGRLFFYVDSERPDSADYSPAGEYYDDATKEFKAIFTNSKPLVEGPISDNFGTFISGLAPVFDEDGNDVVAVIGMDIAAASYWRDIILAGAVPLISGLCLILIISIFEWMRRRNLQLLSLRSELVSVASHELTTPIVGIRWGVDSLEKIVTDEKAAPLIQAIRNSAISLQESAEDILELTHAISDRKLKPEAVDLSKLVHEVLDAQQLTADQRGVTLSLHESWPEELIVWCDGDKIKRVMHNMVSNAIKYTRDNTTVSLAYQQDEKMHRILVSDQGIGIPPTEQGKVLHGFYRASNAIASKVQGTGLGLYLVKTVLEQHGGKVSFISEENKGTTFTLYLPKHTIKQVPSAGQSPAGKPQPPEPAPPTSEPTV